MSAQPIFSERYELLWRGKGPKHIGEVRNYTSDGEQYRMVPIVLDDELMRQINMRFLVTSLEDRGPRITVSQSFMLLPQKLREAGIWHEMGHVHYQHYLDPQFNDQEQLRAARIAAIENGTVVSHEADADRFAVGRIGKDALIDFLAYLIETRPTGGKLGWNEAGASELQLRIKTIKEI